MKTASRIGLAGIVVLSVCVAACAFPGGPGEGGAMGPRGGQGGPPPHMQGRPPVAPPRERLEEAGATAEQIEAIEELRYDTELSEIDLRAGIEKNELKLRRLMSGSDPDEGDVLKVVEQIGEARTKMSKLHVQTALKVRSILGDEISAKLREDRGRRGGQGPGGGFERGGGQGGPTQQGRPDPRR